MPLVPSILKIFLQFVLTAIDPHTSCELVHRDASIPGTYYLYCAQIGTNGIEIFSIGRYVPEPLPATRQ